MKKILFRADAAPHIGIGDLMSLIHLSKYLDESWEVYFVIKNYEAGVKLCDKYGIKAEVLDENIEIDDEVDFLNGFIEIKQIDLIFFEITERKLTDYKGLTCNVKKACVSFDGEILEDMNLVVDWDTEAEKFHNPARFPNTTFLLGYEYVILPKKFYEIDFSQIKRNFPPKKVLIAMGGADEFDFTNKVVEVLAGFNTQLDLTVVVGSGYKNIDILKENLVKLPVANYRLLVNVSNMLELYLSTDVAIGAGGLTVSELVATKTPSCIIATYEHQIHRCLTYEKNGWIKYMGYKTIDKGKCMESLFEQIDFSQKSGFKTAEIVNNIEGIL